MGRTNSGKEGSAIESRLFPTVTAGQSLRERRVRRAPRAREGSRSRHRVAVDRSQTAVDRIGADECRALKSARGISDKVAKQEQAACADRNAILSSPSRSPSVARRARNIASSVAAPALRGAMGLHA